MIRHSITLALCMAATWAFAQGDQPQGPQASQKTALAAPAPVKAKKKTVQEGVAKVLAGEVTTVNPDKKTISIKVKSGNYPVSVEENTTLSAGGKQITFEEIKQGDRVHVDYQKYSNGERKATNINDMTAATKPAPKAKTASKQKASASKTKPAVPAKTVTKAGPASKAEPAATQTAKKTKDTASVK